MPIRTVLIVNPDTNFAETLQHLLEPYDLTSVIVNNGNEALTRARDLGPALLVICVELPGKPSGYELLSTAKRNAVTRNIPIILTSNPADAKAEQVFKEHNRLKNRATEYLFKARFDAREFLTMVDGILGIGPLRDDVSTTGETPIDEIEIPVETDVEMLEEVSGVSLGFDHPETPEEEPTNIGQHQNIDLGLDAEADAAFAAIGADQGRPSPKGKQFDEEATGAGGGFQPPPLPEADDAMMDAPEAFDGPQPTMHEVLSDSSIELIQESSVRKPLEELVPPPAPPPPAPAATASTDLLDLGLDDVQTTISPVSPYNAPPPTPQATRAAVKEALPTPAPRQQTQPPPARQQTQQPAAGLSAADARELDEMRLKFGELEKERQRLERDLADAKARADKAAAGAPLSKEREFLNLRETITRKDKDLRELKDEMGKKDRAILDAKEELRALEGKAGELDEKILAMERELIESHEKIDALGNDKEKALEREKQLKARLSDSQAEVKKTYDEVEAWKARQAKSEADAKAAVAAVAAANADREAAARQAAADLAAEKQRAAEAARAAEERTTQTAARLKQEKEQALAQAQAEREAHLSEAARRHDEALAAAAEQKQADLEALAAEHRAATEALAAEHAAVVEAQALDHAAALGAQMDEHAVAVQAQAAAHQAAAQAQADQHAGALTRAKQEHASTLAQAKQEHASTLAATRQEHADAVAALEAQHAAAVAEHEGALAQTQSQHAATLAATEAEHARVLEEAVAAHGAELAGLKQAHAAALAELQNRYTDEKTGMAERHKRAVADLTEEHKTAATALQGEIASRDRDLEKARGRIEELARDVAQSRDRATELEKTLEELHAIVAERDGSIASLEKSLEDLKHENAGYQDQVVRAYNKLKTDEKIAEKARKAMAVALTLLDEQLRTANGQNREEPTT